MVDLVVAGCSSVAIQEGFLEELGSVFKGQATPICQCVLGMVVTQDAPGSFSSRHEWGSTPHPALPRPFQVRLLLEQTVSEGAGRMQSGQQPSLLCGKSFHVLPSLDK